MARSLVSELEQLSSLFEAELDVSERQAAIDDMRRIAAIERRIAEKLDEEMEFKPPDLRLLIGNHGALLAC